MSYDRMQVALKTFAVDDTSVSGYIYHRYFQASIHGRIGSYYLRDVATISLSQTMMFFALGYLSRRVLAVVLHFFVSLLALTNGSFLHAP